MRVTVIGANRPLGALLASGLREGFEVAAIGAGEVADIEGYGQVDLLERTAMDAVLADAEAVVYTAAFDPETVDEQTLLDEAARGVYVALTAAVEVGVRRMVLVSRLDLVRDYPEEYVVNAQWNPLPRAEAVSLAPMMAEMVGREIARMGKVEVCCLRLGEIDAETTVDDALEAVSAALVEEQSGHSWSLAHVASSGRFAGGRG